MREADEVIADWATEVAKIRELREEITIHENRRDCFRLELDTMGVRLYRRAAVQRVASKPIPLTATTETGAPERGAILRLSKLVLKELTYSMFACGDSDEMIVNLLGRLQIVSAKNGKPLNAHQVAGYRSAFTRRAMREGS